LVSSISSIMDKKGVSEVIGYILTFSAVVTVVTIVYVGGMPLIKRTQENSVFQSMETAFFTIQSNVEKVALGQSPARTVKVRVSQGSLSLSNGSWMNISWTGNPQGRNFTYQSLVFMLGNRGIAYENGAVIEYFPNSSIIVSKPKIVFLNVSGKKYLYISIINVSGAFSKGGSVAELTIQQYPDEMNATSVLVATGNVRYVNISVGGSYSQAWIYYLEEVNASFSDMDFSPPSPHKNYVNVSSPSNFTLTLVVHNVTIG